MVAYLLAHWAYLTTAISELPEWGQAALLAMELWFPHLLVMTLIADVEQLRPHSLLKGVDHRAQSHQSLCTVSRNYRSWASKRQKMRGISILRLTQYGDRYNSSESIVVGFKPAYEVYGWSRNCGLGATQFSSRIMGGKMQKQ